MNKNPWQINSLNELRAEAAQLQKDGKFPLTSTDILIDDLTVLGDMCFERHGPSKKLVIFIVDDPRIHKIVTNIGEVDSINVFPGDKLIVWQNEWQFYKVVTD